MVTKLNKLQYQLQLKVDVQCLVVHIYHYPWICYRFKFVTDFYMDHTILSSGKLPRNKLNFNYVRHDRIASL